MHRLTRSLLGGTALAALAVAPATAQQKHPAFHITALHAGKIVSKTRRPQRCTQHHRCDYSFSVYSSQPASAPPKTHLINTYYRWNSSGTLCSTPKQKVKLDSKKSLYAKIGTAAETYSEGCPSGPTVFYGDTWTNKTGEPGSVDTFVSTLIGKFKNEGHTYKGKWYMNVYVVIE